MKTKLTLLIFTTTLIALTLINCSSCELTSREKELLFKAPAALKLPLQMIPQTESNWHREGELWQLGQGSAGLLGIDAWWQGNRPPRGEMVVLELEYLDNLKLPARVDVYSGLGLEGTFSELHRFGGKDDGLWKIARISCPWDMIFKYLPDATFRLRVISDNGELTVKSFRLTGPLQDDEENYNSETREWVARVQAGKAEVDSAYWSLAQQPVLSVEEAEKPLVVYKRNWMNPILPISAPQAGETDLPMRVRMALNEYEPLQIGIYANGKDLKEVLVTLDPILDRDGEIIAEAFIRVAEYSLVKSRFDEEGFEPFPQRLWPAYTFDVPAGRSHMLWIELHTEEHQAVAGIYRTSLRIGSRNTDEMSLPVELEIMPIRLMTMAEAGLKLGGHIVGLVSEHDLAFQRKYNHNMLDLWYGAVRPGLAPDEKGSIVLDFRLMDEFMSAARRQGFTDVYYFLGGNPYGFPLTMDLERNLAESVLGMDKDTFQQVAMENPDSINPRIAPLISEWTFKFNRHAYEHGWPKIAYTPFDEPAKWVQTREPLGSLAFIRPHFNHWADLMRRGDPLAPIAADIHHYRGGVDFLPWLDIVCTNATHENLDFPDEVRAAGKMFWEFGGCDDRGTPAGARYVLGYYFAAHDSRAAQLWAYNWGNRFDTLEGYNWLYAWYTPFDVIPHPFMVGVREGMDERRLLETLKYQASQKKVDITDFIEEMHSAAAEKEPVLRGSGISADNIWTFPRQAEVMDSWHDAMVEKLLLLLRD